MGPLVSSQVHTINIIAIASASLGALGSLFIIITFIFFKQVRSFATQLMFFLSLSDLLASLAWYPFGQLSPELCIVQGAALHFFLCSSFFWTMCLSISLLAIFYSERFDLQDFLKLFHAICWGVPAVFVFVCLLTGKYGSNGVWCFIKDPKGIYPLFYYIPLLLVLLVNSGVFIAVRLKMSKFLHSTEGRINVVVSFYLLAFIASQLPAVLNTLQTAINPENPVFALFVLHALLQPLQGFFNCVVYGSNEGFVWFYLEWCGQRWGRVRRGKDRAQDGQDTQGLMMDYDYHSDEEA
eukprot:TRINITY_DN5397_c0_g1_i1.p1 TRINITY_DN5397_c0_g1~~TRINITY_DN5397_c0_g1_i1.p1  ORF type:complete len:295 (+),score=59.32 TRINITY_DN5397_c0_g1_i1:58-942(+)